MRIPQTTLNIPTTLLSSLNPLSWPGTVRQMHHRITDHWNGHPVPVTTAISTAQALANVKLFLKNPFCSDVMNLNVNAKGTILRNSPTLLEKWHPETIRGRKCRLQGALLASLERLEKSVTPTTEQHILIEKVQRFLKFSKHKCWFKHDISKNVKSYGSFNRQCTVERHRSPKDSLQPVQSKGRYFNYKGESHLKHTLETIALLFTGMFRAPYNKSPSELVDMAPPAYRQDGVTVQWIGHSTFLVQAEGMNILVDPNFEKSFIPPVFKRYTPPGISLNNLPPIDVILISHNHGDHCDVKAIKHLARYNPLILAPQGTHKWLRNMGISNIKGNKWWDETVIKNPKDPSKEIRLTFGPAQHWTQTTLGNSHKHYWGSWFIQAVGKTLYYSGDTGLKPQPGQENYWQSIRQKFPKIHYALLPIAPEGEPYEHLTHDDALDLMQELKIEEATPIHWGAIRTGAEQLHEPIEKFEYAVARRRQLPGRISILKVGQRHRVA